MDDKSFLTILNSSNTELLEEIYSKYKNNSSSLNSNWSSFFHSIEKSSITTLNAGIKDEKPPGYLKEMGVQNLLNTYRAHGHLAAKLDPLEILKPKRDQINQKLELVTNKDIESSYEHGISWLGKTKLKDLITQFEKIYCDTVGYEHYYLINETERTWLQDQIESKEHNQPLPKEIKLRLYDKLVHADYFEKFLAKKYIAKKRFSLEGGETFIPMLDTLINEALNLNVEGLVLGMAHRGRLNVLVNIMEKPASLIFAEFEEKFDPQTTEYSDVKYHLGYSNYRTTKSGKKIKLSLAFNPSHLEAVNPVVLGSVRARQTILNDIKKEKFIGVLVHGDAAFVGQGVVSETLNLSNLEGFSTGGCIHIVFNNQIGFTTVPVEYRSTLYATDLAKGFQVPIFHVNANDPEACYKVMKLAMKYRNTFKKDILIDLICYRKRGHNEIDEPAFTQPLMYEIIKNCKPTLKSYEEKLLNDSNILPKEIEKIKANASTSLEASFKKAHEENIFMTAETMRERWAAYSRKHSQEPDTQLLMKQLGSVSKALTTVPENFSLHPKLKKLLNNRYKMYNDEMPIDWGFAEALAFGSILESGHNIRLVGQDCARGTFSHRHSVLTDIKTNEKWIPLNHISAKQKKIEIINSPLSEFSVLGFEYGYSLSDPDGLVIWEAQFGDFTNGAQVIIDQFLCSSEVKWLRMSGLVLLLPHGYEGEGPEHSSARLERFLHLGVKENIQVCYPTTPGQFFHLLRRQILRMSRKPLIVMTPKSLLRLPEATSDLEEILHGKFKKFIPDINSYEKEKQIETLILLSGKIYYEVLKERKARKIDNIAIGRVEQLYPFPEKAIKEYINSFPKLKRVYWVQEEPKNMGAWAVMQSHLKVLLNQNLELKCTSRPTSSSPAAGLSKIHAKEQKDLILEALRLKKTNA